MARRRVTARQVVVLIIVIVIVAAWLAIQSAPPESRPATSLSAPSATRSWYEIYFTDPKYPDNPSNHHGGLDEKIVAFMDRAQKIPDVADYDFDLQNVAEAMARDEKRGVRVRMVTDTD